MSYGGGFDYGFGGAPETGSGDAGGFMQGGGSQNPSPGAKKGKDRQTLMPLTIRQLQSASQDHPDDTHRIDGVEVHQVKLVGNILNVNEQSTFTKYDVEDSTGVMEVKLWLDSGDDDVMAERRSACVVGKYVRIIGSLRVFNDSKHVIAHDMRPVKDHNEVTHHFLDAIHVHCQLTKSMGSVPQNQGQGGWGATVTPHKVNAPMDTSDNNMGAFSPVQQRVLGVFNENKTGDENDPGLSLTYVVERLKAQGISEKEVRTCVDDLSNEGHLYSTIDDYHFKSTSDM